MQNNRAIFCIFFATLVFVTMNNTLPIMAGPYIVGELGGSNEIAFYGITFYSIGNALGVPIGRGCMGRMKPENFFLVILSLSAFVSFLITLVNYYPIYLFLRVLQGIFNGTVFPFISTLFALFASKKNQNKITYTIVTIFTVVPSFGAALGGWISYDYHWRWLFTLDLPLFLFSGLYLWSALKKRDIALEKTPFDHVGYIFYALSIMALSLVLTMGQELDWFRSTLITALTIGGTLCAGFFVLWELNVPYPILDLRLLKNLAFSYALVNLAILFSAYFGMVILLSLWLTLWVNYTPLWIGLIIGTMAVAGFLPRILFAEGYEKKDTRIPLAISIFLLAFSSINTMFFNIEINLGRIAFSRVIAGFGLAFFLTPLFRLCFHTFRPEKTMPVINFFQFVRVLASGLGAAVYSTLWQRRQVFFHDRLGSQLTVYSPQTHEYFSKADEIHLHGEQALAQLNVYLDRQSTALALDDCFYLMAWLFGGLFLLLLLTFFKPKDRFFPEKSLET